MTKTYEDIKALLDCELDTISKKQEISEQDLDALDKMIDIIKDMDEMEAMQMSGGMSGARASYGTMMPYMGAGYYNDDATYGRGGRNSYGYNQNYTQGGNSGRNYGNSGGSYGRYDEMNGRMMPGRDWG